MVIVLKQEKKHYEIGASEQDRGEKSKYTGLKLFTNRYTYTNTGTLFCFPQHISILLKSIPVTFQRILEFFLYQYTYEKCSGIIISLSLQIILQTGSFLKKMFW
jgi:hypothetical protein